MDFARRIGLVLLVAAALVAASSPWASAAATKVQSVEGITEYRLDNGLQVLLYPDPSKPTVTVNLTVLVGSRHEGYGETGMAHLLEHMVFKGTPNHEAIPKALQQRGAVFNGSTWVDRTNYYETLPASDENLEFALDLESDRLVNSFVKHEDLLSEMTVVRSEFERGENSPSNLLQQRVEAAAFDWHNYGKSTIGNRTDIERVPINKLQEFYRKHYQPDNCVLVVAGKFDETKALSLIEKYFGKLEKPKRKLDKTYTEEPPQDGERSVTLRRVGDVGIVMACYHAPSGSHQENVVMDILAGIMTSAPSGRLYKALVETKKATNVSSSSVSFHDPGTFEVMAEVRKGDSLDEVRDILLDVTEKSGETTFSSEEVERSKQQLLSNRELAAANTSQIAVQLSEWAAQGDWRLYFLYRDRVEKVTPKDVQEAAKKYLRRDNRTLGMFIPSDKSMQVEVPASPDVAKLLESYKGRGEIVKGETFDVSPANIDLRSKRLSLPEGIKVVVLPKKTRGETVNLKLTLRYGGLDSLKGYEAAAEFLPVMMLRGTKSLSRQQIEDELSKNNATLRSAGDAGTITFTVQTKRANLPVVLDILKQILREPTWPADEFEILRRATLANSEEQLTDPATLAITRIRRTVAPYGKDDIRYTPTVEEEIARYQAVTLEQVKKLYQDFVGSQAGELAIVGDFDVEPTLATLREATSGWVAKQSYTRIPKKYFGDVKGGMDTINTPDKANAVYMAGETFPVKDSDPGFPALVMGNYVLGAGTLSSRLGERVRQKEGLSYGVISFISADSFDPRSSLTINAICNPKNIEKVNKAIGEEVALLLDKGPTEAELDRAKQGFLQQQRVSWSNDGALASVLADTLYVDRTMSYYADLEKKINALKPEAVLAGLKKYIDPKRLFIVHAGDFNAKPAEGEAAK